MYRNHINKTEMNDKIMAKFQLKSLLNNSSLKKLEGNKSIEK